MNYQIVALENDDIINEDIWSVFDKKCEEALSVEEDCIAIQLRTEMGGGVPLLNWIEKWQEKFQKKGKLFYVVSDSPVQLESMELSHPDQNLNYTSTISDLEDHINYSSAPLPVKEVNDEETATNTITENEIYLDDIKSAPAQEVQDIVIESGEVISIAGEYLCQGCGTRRMWMKGKEVTPCDNPECFEPAKGWKLDFDLF